MSSGVASAFATLLIGGFFAAAPSSTNFTLKSYDIGTGGSTSSTNYKLDAQAGVQSGTSASTNYGGQTGELPTQHSNVPAAPTFTNPSSEYNRLKLVITTSGNPTDTKYEVAISSDNFATTLYVQSDNSVAASQDINDYQTYTAWGGASGEWVNGLEPGTTYKVKVRALQGNFTGSAFGPTASAATVQPSITFAVETTLTSTPPFGIAFTSLPAGAVTDADADAVLTLTTNAMFGGTIYVGSANAGLNSAAASYTLPSASANLTSATSGYGGIITAVGQTSGGPMAKESPFDGTSNTVGGLSTALQSLASTSGSVSSGSVTFRLKAKSDSTVPSAGDYGDTLTFVAAMVY